ncbi:nitroreductase family deazaflavin-dependent oxidoreductase [Streptosporangium sp. NPDC001559]|uniref:nitroreductase family deazaflavin-dependent oxidoreductase n=1 Tax=Streptosporangium sp. NPDC001559 TaxID=3366187 RepID=UPI0036F16C2F
MSTDAPTPKSRNEAVIEEFRANKGKVGGFFEGTDLLLLTTVGARSGRPHTTPAVYVRDGDTVAVAASYAGAPKHPAWYHNLVANPEVTVEIGAERYQATAVPAEGAERDRLFALMVAGTPRFNDYAEKTTRVIPMVVLRAL